METGFRLIASGAACAGLLSLGGCAMLGIADPAQERENRRMAEQTAAIQREVARNQQRQKELSQRQFDESFRRAQAMASRDPYERGGEGGGGGGGGGGH